jgi:NTP pyrophosphatase (non-canonical NTP hydrolase)
MTRNEALDMIFRELRQAEEQHPGWPHDPVYGAAIMAEEAGEAMKAALDHHYNRGSLLHLKVELAQTAAMAIRALLSL